MSPEDFNYKEVAKAAGQTILTAGLITLAGAAFSRATLKEIREEANNCCQVTGEPGRHEGSHINHTKPKQGNAFYDDVRNGLYLCPRIHALYHFMFRHVPQAIGLCEGNNNKAIQATKSRMPDPDTDLCALSHSPEAERLRELTAEKCRKTGSVNPFDILDGNV